MDPQRKKCPNALISLVSWVMDMQIPVYAANACYFLVLMIFPALLLVMSSLRYTSLSANDLIEVLGTVVPSALMPTVERLIVNTYYNSSGVVISVSAVTALWSSSRGVYGLLTGLNHVYGVREDRGYFYTRLISVVYTFAFLMVLILTLVLHVFGKSIAAWINSKDLAVVDWVVRVIDIRFLVLLGLQILVFTALYMVLPNRRNRFWSSLPGATVAAVGWQVFSNLFSIYVQRLNVYTNIYGSVYALALGMLWLYICVTIVLFGGVLNRLILRWQTE